MDAVQDFSPPRHNDADRMLKYRVHKYEQAN